MAHPHDRGLFDFLRGSNRQTLLDDDEHEFAPRRRRGIMGNIGDAMVLGSSYLANPYSPGAGALPGQVMEAQASRSRYEYIRNIRERELARKDRQGKKIVAALRKDGQHEKADIAEMGYDQAIAVQKAEIAQLFAPEVDRRTADQKNYEYGQALPENERKAFLEQSGSDTNINISMGQRGLDTIVAAERKQYFEATEASNKIARNFRSTTGILQNYERRRRAGETGMPAFNSPTGPLASMANEARRYLGDLNIGFEDQTDIEVVRTAMKSSMLDASQQVKGAITEREWPLIESTVANMGLSPEANLIIIRAQEKLADAQQARFYAHSEWLSDPEKRPLMFAVEWKNKGAKDIFERKPKYADYETWVDSLPEGEIYIDKDGKPAYKLDKPNLEEEKPNNINPFAR